MKPDRWQEIERFCHLVRELNQAEREWILRKECLGEKSVRRWFKSGQANTCGSAAMVWAGTQAE